MEDGSTVLFDITEVNSKVVKNTLKETYEALEERGYNPINQIVGYIISGDLGYISSQLNSAKSEFETKKQETE